MKTRKSYAYMIDGDTNGHYDTLEDVRHHVWMQSPKDRDNYNGHYVLRIYTNGKESEPVRMIRVKGRMITLSRI